jgi:hypothetical protein
MHDLQRIAGLRHVDTRECAPRTAHQEQIAVGAFDQPRHGCQVCFGDGTRARRITAGTIG